MPTRVSISFAMLFLVYLIAKRKEHNNACDYECYIWFPIRPHRHVKPSIMTRTQCYNNVYNGENPIKSALY